MTSHYMIPSPRSYTNPSLPKDNNQTTSFDQTLALRRERNRKYSKRSRIRKKFLLESLQNKVKQLDEENEKLRKLASMNNGQVVNVDQYDQNITPNDTKESKSKYRDIHTMENNNMKINLPNEIKKSIVLSKRDQRLIKCVTNKKHNFVITDSHFPDNPIVFASNEFFQMSGYKREQIIGKNCRLLQGPHTDPKAVDSIRTAVLDGNEVCVTLLNYKVDGTPFWNNFFVAALRDDDNFIINYIGIQYEVEFHNGIRAYEVGAITNGEKNMTTYEKTSSSCQIDYMELKNLCQVNLIEL